MSREILPHKAYVKPFDIITFRKIIKDILAIVNLTCIDKEGMCFRSDKYRISFSALDSFTLKGKDGLEQIKSMMVQL